MKIYDRSLTGAGTPEAGKTQESQKADRTSSGRADGSAAAGGDRVELSGALGRLSQALAAFGAGRSANVQELAAQYRSGNYQPDSAATSRSMVSEALAAGAQ